MDNDERAPARIADGLRSRLIVILRGHGAYARGRDPWEALHWVMALEESAEIAWLRAAAGR
ncbi:MAG: class II aldolase/adducin family protein [Dehalococcoidia bacterium]|nr:class II aldolase/adducin family protein [Dehalococcoidia bacterium]